MRTSIFALALLTATASAARQPFVSPTAVRASSLQKSSKSALDVVTSSTASLTNVNTNIATIRGGDDDTSLGLMARLKIGGYFGLWYVLNVVYNSEYT